MMNGGNFRNLYHSLIIDQVGIFLAVRFYLLTDRKHYIDDSLFGRWTAMSSSDLI